MTKNNWWTVNPYTAEQIEYWSYSSPSEVDEALSLLQSGFFDWQKKSVAERKQYLQPMVALLQSDRLQIATDMTRQMGKPLTQSLIEVDKVIHSIPYFLDSVQETHFSLPDICESGFQHQLRRRPLGIIWGIMPWNFPLWQAFRMFFPCLLAGNTVLLKSSEITPSMGRWLQKIFDQLGSLQIFRHLMTSHGQTESILNDSRIAGVSLTGSTEAGRLVASLAGHSLKKSVFELGGSDPYLVFPDCDLQIAARKIIQSRMNNAGQVCIAAKRVIVHQSILNRFTQILSDEMNDWDFSDPMTKSCRLGPLAHHRFVPSYLDQCQQVEVLGKKIFEKNPPKDSLAAWVPSRIYQLDLNHAVELKKMEIFGPTLLVFPFQTTDQAIALANSTVYGLGAGIFSEDPQILQRASEIRAGTVVLNDVVKSRVEVPFGGWKDSGFGVELGEWGLTEFTQSQVISKFQGGSHVE